MEEEIDLNANVDDNENENEEKKEEISTVLKKQKVYLLIDGKFQFILPKNWDSITKIRKNGKKNKYYSFPNKKH